jgi:DNA invertase Pin-like site-specific DNA recombinase
MMLDDTSTGQLMIAVLGGLADVERDLIRTRTAEGRDRAKAEESAWAAPLPSPRRTRKRRRAPAATLRELADSYDRSIVTIRRVTRAI